MRRSARKWTVSALAGTVAASLSGAAPAQGAEPATGPAVGAAAPTAVLPGAPTATAAPATVSSPAAPRRHRYEWGDNKWTGGLGATLISSGLTMAGGAGLAVLTEPRAHNETQSRFLHVVGIGVFGLSALSLVTSPLLTAGRVAKKPDAPLAPAPFFVGAGAIALGGAAVSVGALTTLGDENDSPWDDGRGVAIASGAVLAAFGVTLVLVGATDSGVPDVRRPWQRSTLQPAPSVKLLVGAGSACLAGEL